MMTQFNSDVLVKFTMYTISDLVYRRRVKGKEFSMKSIMFNNYEILFLKLFI